MYIMEIQNEQEGNPYEVILSTELNRVPGFSPVTDYFVEQIQGVARGHRVTTISLTDVIEGLGSRFPSQAKRS